MHIVTLASFLFFTGLVAAITIVLTRRDDHDSAQGYFLGGRRLTGPVIAGSLLLTNLSTEQMVGLNGAAFKDGLCVMAWEVIAVLALVCMALFFLPRYLRSGISTVPQFLEGRFDQGTRTIATLIFLVAYAAILLPIVLYTGARGLSSMMDLSGLTGIQNETTTLWITIWLVGIIGSFYAIFGGLRTVAVSDTLNGIGLLAGGFLITYFGLQAVSGGEGIFEGFRILKETQPERFNSIGSAETSVPFGTLFTGVLLLNVFYWCTNQQIIQRTLGARSLVEGQKGVLLTGFLKLLGPMYLVLPGMMAYTLYAGQDMRPDLAYGTLVHDVLPAPLTGFFAAVMVGAILSSFNSALNSAATLFGLGIYKRVINKEAAEEQVVKASKTFGWVMAIIAMTVAPMLAGQESIFKYLQKMNGLYAIPIFAVVLMGMLTKRVPAKAGKVGLILGFVAVALGYFVPPLAAQVEKVGDFHFQGIVFLAIVGIMLAMGALKPRATPWVHEYSGDVDITPWKHAKLAGAILVVLVLLLYASFADLSVLT